MNNQNRGENNKRSKLLEHDVIEIFNSSLSQKELTRKYFVSQGTISQIKNGKIWSWLTKKDNI